MKKRGIAFLLMASMLFSMGSPAFAAEGKTEHIHNQGGWQCSESTTLGENVCEMEEHAHLGACAQTAEPTLACDNAEEGHTHADECYVAGEIVQTCDLTEHTHSDDCFALVSSWDCTEPMIEEVAAETKSNITENHFMNRSAFETLIKQRANAPANASVESTSVGIVTVSDNGRTSRETQINSANGIKFYNQDTRIDSNGTYIQASEVTEFQVGFTYWYWRGALLTRATANVTLVPTDFDFVTYPEINATEWWVAGQNQELSTIDLTFDYNDGTNNAMQNAMIEIKPGSTLESIEAPVFVREKYDFIGWFANPEATQGFDASQAINEDTTVFAGWKEKVYTPDVPAHISDVRFYVNLAGSILNANSLVSNNQSTPAFAFTGALTNKLGIAVNYSNWAKDYPSAYTSVDAANYNGIYGNQKTAGLVGKNPTNADDINSIIRQFIGVNVPDYTGDSAIMAQIKNEILQKNKTILTINKNVVSVDLINEEYYTPQWYVVKLDNTINDWHIDGVLKETPKFDTTFTVTYKWDASAPAAAKDLLPNEGKAVRFAENTNIKIMQPAKTTIEANGGTYTFTGWKNGTDAAVDFELRADTELVGSWEFVKTPVAPDPDPKPDPDPDPKPDPDPDPKPDPDPDPKPDPDPDPKPDPDPDPKPDPDPDPKPDPDPDPKPDPDPSAETFDVVYLWSGKAPAAATLPNEGKAVSFEENTDVTVDTGASYTTVVADGGTYTFQGWKIGENVAADFKITANTQIIGTWSFVANSSGTDDRDGDEDEEDITDPDVPLTDGDKDNNQDSDKGNTDSDKDKVEDEVDVGDNDTPLTNPPQTPDANTEQDAELEVEVADKDVPLSSLPKTGGLAGSLIAFVGAAAIAGGFMLKRKDENK